MGLDGIYEVNNESQVKIVPADYDNAKMSQEDFLKVLLANIQWQDPLEAQDISQFIDNSVKLREMEVLNSFESSVDKLISSLDSYSLFFASSFIGKEIQYSGNQTYVKEGKGRALFTLSEPASEVRVSVLDSSGNVVEEKLFTDLSAGTYPIEIDNPSLPDGYYTVSVIAKASDGSSLDVKVESYALVEGVKREEDGKVYALTGVSEIPLDEITAIGG